MRSLIFAALVSLITYARIAADSTLNSSPLSTNGMTFGFEYRF